MQIRRDLIDYEYLSPVPYFLLLTQAVGFLWDKSVTGDPNASPTYVFPMNNVVARYNHEEPKKWLYGPNFELLVLQWLNNLTERPQQNSEEPEKTLALLGFNDSIKNASVFLGDAA